MHRVAPVPVHVGHLLVEGGPIGGRRGRDPGLLVAHPGQQGGLDDGVGPGVGHRSRRSSPLAREPSSDVTLPRLDRPLPLTQARSRSSRVPGKGTGTRSSSAPRTSTCSPGSRAPGSSGSSRKCSACVGADPSMWCKMSCRSGSPGRKPRNTKDRWANSSRRKLATAAGMDRRCRSAGEKQRLSGSDQVPSACRKNGLQPVLHPPVRDELARIQPPHPSVPQRALPGVVKAGGHHALPGQPGRQVERRRQGARPLGLHLGQHLLDRLLGELPAQPGQGRGRAAPVHQIDDRARRLARRGPAGGEPLGQTPKQRVPSARGRRIEEPKSGDEHGLARAHALGERRGDTHFVQKAG